MATKNSSFTPPTPNKLPYFVLIMLFALSLNACKTAPKSTQAPGPSFPTSPEVQVPPQPTQPIVQPSPQAGKRVAVVLGPGGAKALAHAGVLKVFQQQRIPIEKIVGLEWGALIGGIYAHKGQAHDVEWKLYKMAQRNLPNGKEGFFGKRLGENSVKSMNEFLQESFVKDTLSDAKISFSCPARSMWTGVVAWQTRGQFKDVMKNCLPYPPTFKVQGTFFAGASQAREAIESLRKEGFNIIVVVNVLGSAMPVAQDSLQDHLDYVILWQEVKRAMAETAHLGVEVVNVDTSAYPIVMFEAQKELIALGESSAQRAAKELINKYGF